MKRSLRGTLARAEPGKWIRPGEIPRRPEPEPGPAELTTYGESPMLRLQDVTGGMIDCPLPGCVGHTASVTGARRIRPVPDPSGDPEKAMGEVMVEIHCPMTTGGRWLSGKTHVRRP